MFLNSKSFWKRFGIGCLIVVAVLLLAYTIVEFWTGRRLENRLAKLRAAGEPVSIADLEAPVPVDDNAAMVLADVRQQIKEFSNAQGMFDKTSQGLAYRESGSKTVEPTVEQVNMIRGILAMYPQVPTAIEKAAGCNYHVPLLDYSVEPQYFLDQLLHSTKLSRGVSRFCNWQITVALADGDYNAAARTGINMLKLARLRDAEPTITNGLLDLALRSAAVEDLNRVLRSGEISPEVRSELDNELARHDDPLWMVKIMKTERAYNLDASSDLFSHFPMTWLGKLVQVDTLDVYEDLLAVLAKPRYESRGELQAVFERSYSTPISESLVRLFEPSLRAARDSFDRTVVEMRCLRILNADQRQSEQVSDESLSLDEVELPESAKIDPYSGESLNIKKSANGWVIYSVFKNGKDDGGNFEAEDDWGVAPLGYPGAN
jgi:hypothetical protein